MNTQPPSRLASRLFWAGLLASSAMLPSCHQAPSASNDATLTQANSAQPALPDAAATSAASSSGPEVLSTLAANDGKPPLSRVVARQGTFAIQNINGTDTLTVNGKPASYKEDGADAPTPVAANDAITLVGVFELPQESVAWVVVTGGTACPGTHVLVGARSGLALPGQGIPGCDDRGSMRRDGDTITFQAGGSEGSYKDGVVTTTAKPAGYQQPAAAPVDMVPAR